MDLLSGHLHKSHAPNRVLDKRHRKQDSFAEQSNDLDEGIMTGAHPKHKSSRDPFLVWVAFERNRPQINEKVRRTCPLVDCEEVFGTPDQMQQHIVRCLQDSSDIYRCYKCRRKEKIGRYHFNRCTEIENHGGRMATVKNSFRSAKKRLTPRPQLSVQQNFEESSMQNERQCYEKEGSRELAELSSQFGVNAELSGGETSEWLPELSQSYYFSSNRCQIANHTANPLNQDRPHVELAAEPMYRSSQSWQEPIPTPSASSVPTLPFRDLTSPCSPASPLEIDGWHNKSPVSPFGYEHSYSGFHQSMTSQQTSNHSQIHHQSPLTDRDFSSSSIVPGIQSWNGFSYAGCSPTNNGSNDLPELSNDAESREFSASSGTESLPSQAYWNESSPMILQDSEMSEEPESYDHIHELESYERPVELANTVQNWSLPLDDNSVSFGLPPSSLWLQGPRFCASNENRKRNMSSDPDMNANALLSTNSTPSDLPSRRSASRRLVHRTTCPCGFEPKGIPKNRRGNLKRHMRGCRNLREQAHPESSPDPKPWVCNFPNCGKKFSRCDNRAQHQRFKSHGPYASSSTSPAAPNDFEAGEFGPFGNFQIGDSFLR